MLRREKFISWVSHYYSNLYYDLATIFFFLFFYWRIIALQNFIVFCHTTTWISHKVKSLSRVQLLATPRTAAYQAPPSVGFSRQEYWSGVPLPSPVSHRSTYIPSLLSLLQSPSPSHPFMLIQSPCLSFLSHTTNSYWLSILHMVL